MVDEKEMCMDEEGGSGGQCFLYHEGLCMYDSKKSKKISRLKLCPLEGGV